MNSVAQHSEFSDIVTSVLADNTAQSVLNHLKALESNRAHVRTRWIWELLQNARDASAGSNGRLVASVEQNEDEIIFRHNGDNFNLEEIAHLIYHGSTKVENEETIGQYGSGFLTTHLLSPEIGISGRIEDGRGFDFRLRRELGSVGELSKSMQQAAQDFESSLTQNTNQDNFTTEFRYPLLSDVSEVVEAGIAALKKCAPLVVAFNREFSAIRINSPSGYTEFSVTERSRTDQTRFELITVSEAEAGNRKRREYLLAHGEKFSIAIPLDSAADGRGFLTIDDTPRLFLGFPLIGTESFSFPAVVNSFRFTPSENRDGVHLGQGDNQANRDNQEVIEEASKLLVSLLGYVASSNWADVCLLTEIPAIQQRDWLNPDWLREHFRQYLVPEIRRAPVVLTEDGAIAAEKTILPFAEREAGDEGVEALWDLLNGLTWVRKKLPRRDESVGWCNSIESWAGILDRKVTDLKESHDGRKLATYIEENSRDTDQEYGQVENLQALLQEDVAAMDWLDQFCGFLKDYGFDEVIRSRSIIPDQGGFLRTLPELHRDQAIPEELKEIAVLLEWKIREELRHTQLAALAEEVGAGNRDTGYVARELIRRLRDRAEGSLDTRSEQASIRLFSWIVRHENWNLLRDFPVFADPTDSSGNRRIVKLEINADDDTRPLAPVSAWESDLQRFSELFPKQYILAEAFFESAPHPATWKTLDEKGFLRTGVLVTSGKRFREFLPDKIIKDSDYEATEHETQEPVTVTNVVFMSRKNVGIMDRVRGSRRLALLLWGFLVEWLVPHDTAGLEAKETLCICEKSHRYYPAEWLVPLVENKWVPLGERRSHRATAQSLASLLRNSKWDYNSMNDDPSTIRLLEAIDITRFDLMRGLVSEDERARTAVDGAFMDILAASGGDVSRLSQAHLYLKNLATDPDLLQVVEERLNRIRRVRENRCLGGQVEDLVKQVLEAEEFVVRRTGIGSDFEIEYDSADTDDVARLELARSGRTWLIEVKATRGRFVRMTAVQARTSVDEGDGFLLCVVPITGKVTEMELRTIQDDMKFVANIGPRLASLCEDLKGFQELRTDITAHESQGVQLEVESGAARIRVTSPVWEEGGIPLAELAERLAVEDAPRATSLPSSNSSRIT